MTVGSRLLVLTGKNRNLLVYQQFRVDMHQLESVGFGNVMISLENERRVLRPR